MRVKKHKDSRKILIHVDVDSPLKLFDFYKLNGIEYSIEQLEKFYSISWSRALDFFEKLNIKATFFVVGNEFESNQIIRDVILNASNRGHEIENHTYSHPFGLAHLSDDIIKEEVEKCSILIKNLTGKDSIGFRSPGYSINTNVINVLEDLNFKYDSSGFWSVMNPLLSITQRFIFKNGINHADFGGVSMKLPHNKYVPCRDNWLIKTKVKRDFNELTLPRTSLLGLPFYNNFNLWAPFIYSKIVSKSIKRDNIVYLFHIIEFMDMSDDIPKELIIHPNLKIDTYKKMNRAQIILTNLMKRYEFIETRKFIELNQNL